MKVRIKKLPQARTGYQVQGSLANDVPAMGGADYNAYIGKPNLKSSKYITRVPREEANLEAEGGETVYGDINGDGMAEHKIIKGPRHSSGGVPLNLPDDTFIYSDFRGMNIKEPEFLEMFGKGGKGKKSYTPAALAKQYDIEKYRKILQDPNSDNIDRKTAELMIKNYQVKLAALALVQEGKKGFPQGMPTVAKPMTDENQYTEDTFVDPSIKKFAGQIDGKIKQAEEEQNTADQDVDYSQQLAQAQEMNQGEPIAQAQPMAQYGMEMGGFDIPFSEDMPAAKYGMSMEEYDLPEAEYGMAMGITSKNYMGRPKSPMYARGGALRTYQGDQGGSSVGTGGGNPAATGNTLDISGMDAAQANKAYYMWKRKNPNKEPELTQDGKKVRYVAPKKNGDLSLADLKALNDTEMKFLKTELNNPNSKIRAELIKHTREALLDPNVTSGKMRKAYNTNVPSDQKIIDGFLNHKDRADKIKQAGIDTRYFTNNANALMTPEKMLEAGIVKDIDEAKKIHKEYTDKGWTSKQEIAKTLKLNLPADSQIGKNGIASLDAGIEQATSHGIARMQIDKKNGKYDTWNDDDTYLADQFLGKGIHSRESNTGAGDNPAMAKIYGKEYATLSANEGFIGNTTLGESINPAVDQGVFEPIPDEKKDDKPCEPCQRADGSSYVPVKNADGTCSECTQEIVPGQEPEPKMWLQDRIKTSGAFVDLMSAKKYMPWTARYDLRTPKPTFMDPTRELAANAEQANIQSQALAQFAGPQSLSARASGVMGAASKNAADILAKYNNANVNIANQFETTVANIENQEQQLNTAAQQKLYDQNTISNQQYDNTKRALRNNLMNQTVAGITNKMKSAALNKVYPDFYVDTASGGDVRIDPTKARGFKPDVSTDNEQAYYDECSKRYKTESAIQDCVENKMKYSGFGGSSNNAKDAYNAQFATAKKGGFIYGDITYPFIL
jgi:hypothetical protein